MIIVVLLFILGLITIIKGGDIFVDSAVWLARATGMPNMLVGATVVSLATTLPELFVSSIATYRGAQEIAIGNAIGSTICNIGLILALSAVFMPSIVDRATLRSKGLLMIVTTMTVFVLSRDRVLTSKEGLILISLLAYYVYLNIMEVKKAKNAAVLEVASEATVNTDRNTIIINMLMFILGALLMVIGARLLVDNSIEIARLFNIPEAIISVTIVALGTSLPELTTTVTAIVKRHNDLSIGNIIGANILNGAMILGISALVSTNGLVISSRGVSVFNSVNEIPQTLYIDIPVALILMIVAIFPSLRKGRLSRSQGIVMLTIYITYLVFLKMSF